MHKKALASQSKISETLLIPLYARAREYSQRPPLLIDITAVELVNKIDYDFKKFDHALVSMTGVVIRANYFDVIVRQFIAQHDQPIVVHLGCGLDTRCQRLGAHSHKAHFYQIDLADVIHFRQQLLAAQHNETYMASCMFDAEWMAEIARKHPSSDFIFIIEGVLMYWEAQDCQALFALLAEHFPGAQIHFDVISTWLSLSTHLHDSVRFTSAEFKFGINDDSAIEQWHPRLRYQGSFNLMGFDAWQRSGWQYAVGQMFFPALKSAARVVAYYIKK